MASLVYVMQYNCFFTIYLEEGVKWQITLLTAVESELLKISKRNVLHFKVQTFSFF